MKKIIFFCILVVVALAAGLWAYLFKSYQESQVNDVRLYKNEIEGKAMKDITGSFETQNQQIKQQLSQ